MDQRRQMLPETRSSNVTAALHLGLLIPLLVGGCGKSDDADEFRAGVPQHEDVTLAFPGAATAQSALTAGGVKIARAALLGDKAEMYSLTRAITASANGGTVATLALLGTITDFPATSVAANVAVWGPYTDPLSPNTWRLTVQRESAGQYAYVFEAKAKNTADSGFVTVLSGHHVVTNPTARRRLHVPAYGHGDFVLDWDAAQSLPEHDTNVGKAAFGYSRPDPLSGATIQVTFTQIRDEDTGMLVDAAYAYTEAPAAGGGFQFSVKKDAIKTTSALETLTVRSRWLQTGAGRSDAKFSGGDVGPTEATGNECWDANFRSVYQFNSYGDASKIWGLESACPFTPAEYSAGP
jgi:hypothetical protein